MVSRFKNMDTSRVLSATDSNDYEVTVASLATMEVEIAKKTAQLNTARQLLLRNGSLEKANQRAELEQQLLQAEESIRQSQAKRHELQAAISRHSSLLNSLIDEETSLSTQVANVTREKRLDLVRYVDVELHQFQDHQTVIQQLLRTKKAQCDAIRFELSAREQFSVDNLQHLLRRATVLQSEAESKSRQDASNFGVSAPLDRNASSTSLESLISKRSIERQNLRFERDLLLRQMNLSRSELLKEMEISRLKKSQALSLQKKGMCVLEDVELGRAPPIKFLLANDDHNLSISPENKLPRDHVPDASSLQVLEERLVHHREQLAVGRRRLQQLQTIGSRDGESERGIESSNSYSEIRSHLIKAILPGIVKHIMERETKSLQSNEEYVQWQKNKNDFEMQRTERELTLISFTMWNAIVDATVSEMVLEIASSTIGFYESVFRLIKNVLLKDSNVHQENEEINLAFDEIMFMRSEKHCTQRYQHRCILTENAEQGSSDEAEKGSKSSFSFLRKLRNEPVSRLIQSTPSDAVNADATNTLAIDEHVDAINIYPMGAITLCSPTDTEIEREYCSNWSAESGVITGGTCSKGYMRIHISANNQVILLAGLDGSLEVVCIGDHDVSRRSWLVAPPDRKRRWVSVEVDPISMIQQAITLDNQGRVQVWRCSRSPNKSRSRESIMGANLLYSLSAEDLSRAYRSLETAPVPLVPSVVRLDMALNFDLSPAACVIGTTSGVMLRWNLNKPGLQLTRKSLATREPPLAKSSRNSTPGPFIKREYLHGHRAPVKLIGAIGASQRPDHLISLDFDGNLCVWTCERFSGFDWFDASKRHRIEIIDSSYSVSPTAAAQLLFPVPGASVVVNAIVYEQDILRQLKSDRYYQSQPGVYHQVLETGSTTMVHTLRYDPGSGLLCSHERIEATTYTRRGRIIDAKMLPSQREILMLSLLPRDEDAGKPTDSSFHLISVDAQGDIVSTKTILRLTQVNKLDDPTQQSAGLPLWQISRLFDPPGTDFLVLLQHSSAAVEVVSLASGSLIYRLPIPASSMNLVPRDMAVFGTFCSVAIVYENCKTVDMWTLVDNSTENDRRKLPISFRKRSERLHAVPVEHRIRHCSTQFGFGYTAQGAHILYFDIFAKLRGIVLDLVENVTSELTTGTPT